MSDLERMLSGDDATDVERLLLRAGAAETPSPHARDATLAVLGVGGAAGAGAASIGAALKGSAGALGTASKASATGSALAAGGLTKWVAILAVGGAVTVGSIHVARSPGEASTMPVASSSGAAVTRIGSRPAPTPPAPLPAASEVVVASAAPVATPPGPRSANPRASAAVSAATARTAPTLPPAAPSALPPPATSAVATDALGPQVLALDEARRALDAHDPARCLAALAAFRSRFPTSALAPEVAVLEIRALVAAGRRDEAALRAAAFARENPGSPYGASIARIVAAP